MDDNNTRLACVLAVRLSSTERKVLDRAAAAAGQPVSTYVRDVALVEAAKRMVTDQVKAPRRRSA